MRPAISLTLIDDALASRANIRSQIQRGENVLVGLALVAMASSIRNMLGMPPPSRLNKDALVRAVARANKEH